MSGYKDILKNAWHPEKSGTSLKGQMKSLVGRGDERQHSNHVAPPLSSLRDPAQFAPPPKRRTGTLSSGTNSPASQTGPYAPPTAHSQATNEQPEEPAPAPKPWSLDTTGLSTAHLPPPPGRKYSPDGRLPPPVLPSSSSTTARKVPPPSLPPRLPPRSNTSSPATSPAFASPPPTIPSLPTRPLATIGTAAEIDSSSPLFNQNSINRLGAAGISVPGLGIGHPAATSSPPPPPSQPDSNTATSELRARFSQLRPPSSSPPSTTTPNKGAGAPAAGGGTTWQQKQAALKTAAAFHQDPSKVSFSEMKDAAKTVNNFRERHGEQAGAGLRTANGLYNRYGGGQTGGENSSATAATLAKTRPPPPPPPKKKPGLMGKTTQRPTGVSDEAPPPIPVSTRPNF